MKKLIQYTKLQCKRMQKSLLGIFMGSMILLIFCGILSAFCIISSKNSSKNTVTTIGVVAQPHEAFVDWMLSTMEESKNTKDTLKFVRLSEKRANAQLQDGKINIVFIIPKDYIKSIIDGRNKHVTIRFAKGEATIVSFLFKELSSAASSFILSTEAGIYSMQEYYTKFGLSNKADDEFTLNVDYIKEIVKLDRSFQAEETSAHKNYSTTATYIVSATVLFLMLWGLTCSKMLSSQNQALKNMLYQHHFSSAKQILAQSIAFFLTCLQNYLLLSSLLLLTSFVGKAGHNTIPLQPKTVCYIIITFLPILLLATSFIQCIYEIAKDASSGVLLLFITVMVMGLFSGCFYPMSFLPTTVQKIGQVLPIYHACQYGLSVTSSQINVIELLWTLGYTFAFCLLSLAIRHSQWGLPYKSQLNMIQKGES